MAFHTLSFSSPNLCTSLPHSLSHPFALALIPDLSLFQSLSLSFCPIWEIKNILSVLSLVVFFLHFAFSRSPLIFILVPLCVAAFKE